MSVILKFTIEDEAFHLGQVLAPPPHIRIELERIVPTGDQVTPFLWVQGNNIVEFEERVRNHPSVVDIRALDKLDDGTLYRIKWKNRPTGLIKSIAESDAVVLEARGNDPWTFRLRFSDHENLSLFHNSIIEHDISIHIERTYTLSERTEHGHRFDLTPDQREALILALQRGYFASPRAVSLDELADEFEITRQAISKRIRRGNEKILREILLSSTES